MLMKKKNINSDKLSFNTIIGPNVTIEGGTLRASDTVRIDGTYIGEINCTGNIIIGQTGNITGNVNADSIIVSGLVNGNIVSVDEVHLTHTATVTGDVKAKNLIVDGGALIDGNLKMIKDQKILPKAEEQKKLDKNKK